MLLVVHLRMTGRLLLAPEPGSPRAALRAAPAPGRQLLFYDTRRFGRVWAVPGRRRGRVLRRARSRAVRRRRSRPTTCAARSRGAAAPLKSFLLDQRRIAGVGNIYADEAAVPGAPAARCARPARSGPARSRVCTTPCSRRSSSASTTTAPRSRRFVDPAGSRGAFQEILNVYGRARRALPRVRHAGAHGSSSAAAARTSARAASRCRAARLAAGGREALERERVRRAATRRRPRRGGRRNGRQRDADAASPGRRPA